MKKKFLKTIKEAFFITIGLTIAALGWTAFVIPAKISGGGITGLMTLVYYATGFKVGYSVFIVNTILVLVAIKLISSRFGIGSVFGIIVFSGALIIFQKFITKPIIEDKFLSALIGGGLSGFGTAIAFMNGGNGGGLDIIGLLVARYRNISPGRVIFYANLVIIGASFFITKKLEGVIYSYVVMAASTYMLDYTLDGAKQSYQISIISKKSKEIADALLEQLGTGVTIIRGVGWYSKKETDIILVIVHKNYISPIHRIIMSIDKEAFVSEAKVAAVFGKRYQELKV